MSEIALHPTSASCITCVPDYFIDKYMIEANGEYVKIFLYLLRSLGRSMPGFSIAKIAEDLEHTQKDVRKALHYWESMGLLELEYDDCDELNSIFLKDPVDAPIIEHTVIPAASAPVFTPIKAPIETIEKKPFLMPVVDEDLKQMVYFAEKLLSRIISENETRTISAWHDSLGLSWDLIEYIIEYSTDKGIKSFQYMNKIALDYANNNINTVEAAKGDTNAHLSLSFAVKSAFGITGRNLGDAELAYVSRWSSQMGFSNEIISEACKRTILKTHQANFEYANSILESWKKANVKVLSDLEILDSEFKANSKKHYGNVSKGSSKQIHNFPQRNSYDFKELETTLLQS